MANITKKITASGTKFIARVRIKSKGEIIHNETKTFNSFANAKAWNDRRRKEVEKEIAISGKVKRNFTLSQLLDDYIKFLEDRGELKRSKYFAINYIKKCPIAKLKIEDIGEDEIIDHGRYRFVEDKVKASTINTDIAFIKSALKYAYAIHKTYVNLAGIELGISFLRDNGFIAHSEARVRRISKDEYNRLIDYFQSDRRRFYMVDIVNFAIASARRQNEICGLLWKDLDIDNSKIFVRDLKDPYGRKVSKWAKLSKEALDIITNQPKIDERIFPRKATAISALFTRACKRLGIEDLRFHDLRHEAASYLAELGYTIPEVQHFTLHGDWQTLSRYTHLDVDKIKLRS